MKFQQMAKIGALAAAVCLGCSSIPVMADGAENVEVIFTDVTGDDYTTLSGEAKIKVSVKGAGGNATIAQMALNFTGDLKYKSIQFMQGENKLPDCFLYSPNTALANSEKKLLPSIISRNPMSFGDETDLFILTFAGESGGSVTLNIDDLNDTYCTVDGKDLKASENKNITVKAADKANEGKNAVIKLVMDKVDSFAAGNTSGAYTGSGIEVKITGEKTNRYTLYTVLNNTLVSKGGHRESVTVPTFTLENTVLADDTYTVEVSGIGYVPYKKTGVTFDKALELTNADFIPGDVNADGKVDKTDKEECQKAMDDPAYAEDLLGAADFNRDGRVDKYDMKIFDAITDGDNGNESGGNESGGGSSSGGGGSSSGGGGGGGSSSGGGGGGSSSGGGGGGSSSGGGGGASLGGGVTVPVPTEAPNTNNTENGMFTDLGSYSWAEDSIYSLRDKGIINGVSDTLFAPANNIKRGDFILILTRMLGIDNAFDENFADVPESAYYYEAVGAAKAAGIANGDGGNFMPENSITRQDLITLAYRAFLEKEYISETEELSALDVFSDNGDISDYAKTAMASMVNAGIIKGSDGKVNPKGNATRAEVAVMCARLCELMK